MNELQIYGNTELAVADVKAQIAKIQDLMKSVMKEGEHYGKIPGVEKDSLYKSGAEKLCFTFRLFATFEYSEKELPNNHREYKTVCVLKTINGDFVSQGVGTCSTMESKYRWRSGVEIIKEILPGDYWDNKEKYNDIGLVAKKINGVWKLIKMTGDRTENPDIADQYNTVLKMSEKRAYVDATIRGTACSDIFTQDVEDMVDDSIATRNVTNKNGNKTQKQDIDKKQDKNTVLTLEEKIKSIVDPNVKTKFWNMGLATNKIKSEKEKSEKLIDLEKNVDAYLEAIKINDAVEKGHEKLDAVLNDISDMDANADAGFNAGIHNGTKLEDQGSAI